MLGRGQRSGVVALFAIALVVGSVPAAAQRVPSPEEVLGFKVGADYHLATYAQAHKYYTMLAQVSPLIRVFEVGKTPLGRPMIYAVITSAENMAKLDRYKEIARRLSLVRGVSPEEARKLAAEGRAVVYIDGGLHASECAPAQHLIQLAYDLVTGQDEATRRIREQVVTVLVFANPDGMDLLAEWYHPNVGTPYEVSPMPRVYNKYVGHDNNRDSYIANLVETQYLTKIVHQEWFPQILYNQHQTAPFPARIWVHPAAEPTNPNVHPLLVRWQNLLGTAMGAAFDRENKPGAISRTVFDTWYPGYVTQVVDSHNIVSLLTETALYRYATPRLYTLEDFPEAYRDLTVSTFYPSPWKGGWWRLKDAVDYCITASRAVLDTAAVHRQELQLDKYQMGREVMAKFEKEPPYAYIVPDKQWDLPTAALMLQRMQLLGVQVNRASEAFVADGVSYPAGTWVIPMAQPFAYFVKNLFEEQRYPDLTKNPSLWQALVQPQKFQDAWLPPYDMAGWTLPYQMGVKAIPALTPVRVAMTPVETVALPPGKVDTAPAAGAYVLSPKVNNSFTAVNRILDQGGEVLRASDSVTAGGETHPPGAFIVPARRTPRTLVEALARELSISAGSVATVPANASTLRRPRIGLYQSWVSSMDEGWIRWIFDQFDFDFAAVHDAEVRAGALQDNYDVFVIPSMGVAAIVDGHKPGTMPPQYVGGIGEAGVQNIRRFVENGGTLVLVNNATQFAIDKLKAPVADALKEFQAAGRQEGAEAKAVEFACPGSVLRMSFDVKHPVAYGMPEEAPAMFVRSPAFSVATAFSGEKPVSVIAKYPGANLLMSGFLKGEQHLHNRASAVEVPLGKGRMILLGFGVQQRGQPYGTFKLLFNALYYSTLAKPTPASAP